MDDFPIKYGRKNRHIKLPNGFHRVTDGVCKEGDMFIDASAMEFHNKVYVLHVTNEEIGDPVDAFDILIRKDV